MKMKDKTYTIIVTASIPVVLAGALAFAALIPTGNGSTARKLQGAIGWEIMRIDGNRNGHSVEFTHESHQQLTAKNGDGCAVCHHLNLPGDNVSSCFECHKDMQKKSSIFDHEGHARLYRNKGTYCKECHGSDRSRESVKTCAQCHEEYTQPVSTYTGVRGYEPAMHGSCIACHHKEDEKLGQKMFTDCGFCHPDAE